MQKRILPIALTAIVLICLFSWSCTKLDTTDIGSDLLPAVDNVHTFDTTLVINSSQGYFNDTTTAVGLGDDHVLGSIANDPIFGRTTANIFMQLKPKFYPYYFGNAGDTLVAVDSIVLCLKYTGFWGDSMNLVHLEVKEVNEGRFRDSIFKTNPVSYQPTYSGSTIGSKDIDVTQLGKYMKYANGRDSVRNQIRIPLNQAWANQLFGRDSISSSALNNAFYTDSLFRRFYNGLAVLANGSGNGLLYVSLTDTATKLEIHFRKRKNGISDTLYTGFRLNTSLSDLAKNPPSNAGNFVSRDRSGFPASVANSNEHYIQTAPGTFVNLNIPGLAGFPNSIIHRAEIIVEQVTANAITDAQFSSPNFLYLDLKDTGTVNKYKPVYFDLNPGKTYDPDNINGYFLPAAGEIDFVYFGGFKRNKTDAAGTFNYYNFNVTRYLQHLLTDRRPNYGFRLYSPFNISYPQYSAELVPFSNNVAYGRVKIGSGSNSNRPLRLRIIYSKL